MNPETSNCSDDTLRGLIVWANPAVIKLVWLPVSKNTDDACPDSADKLVETGIDLECALRPCRTSGMSMVCRLASTIGKARRWVNPLGGPVEERASPCRHSADVQVCPLSTSFSSKYILASRVRPIGDKGARRPLTTSGVRPVHLKPMEAVGAPIVDRSSRNAGGARFLPLRLERFVRRGSARDAAPRLIGHFGCGSGGRLMMGIFGELGTEQ
ncbi:hypothetical protein GPALN_010149 [Globodera pallida]|nr:hypothetical protein GPALN_010149 [Globodera pallida]